MTNLPSDGAFVFTERDVFSLRLVPVQEQIQALVRQERVEEALLLLDGVHAHCPLDSYTVRQHGDTEQSCCRDRSLSEVSWRLIIHSHR